MPKKSSVEQISGQQLGLLYLAMLVANAIIIYLGNIFFPTRVVIGTFSITPFWAILHSAGTLALINSGTVPTLECWMEKYGFIEKNKRAIIYLLANFVGLWLISRFSQEIGLGLSSWFITLVLALASTIVEKFALKTIPKLK